jgi:TonB-dependent SusC/RagA subfamily outer membrane receptor
MKKIISCLCFVLLALSSSGQKHNSEKENEIVSLLNKYFFNASSNSNEFRTFFIFHDTLIIFHSSSKEKSQLQDTTLIDLKKLGKVSLLRGKGINGIHGMGIQFTPLKNLVITKAESNSNNSKINDKQLSSTVGTINQKIGGQAAGVVVGNDKSPGGNPGVRIRGVTSVLSNNNPLYIVDGVPITNINLINPDDIASIEVLKDPSATAMYGMRGSNGVILIKTKRGDNQDEMISDDLKKQKELPYALWVFGEKAVELKKSNDGKRLIKLLKTKKN